MILLPATTALQRAEAKSLITSRMQNKQDRPFRSFKQIRSLSLPLLNPEDCIHDAHAPQKLVSV